MSEMFRLQGLTTDQRNLMTVMWSKKSNDDFEDWFLQLSESDKCTARSLAQLLFLEMLEKELPKTGMKESKAIIKKIMLS